MLQATKQKIIPVILCGGSGTRLWPLSREKSPKQFHPIVSDLPLLQDTVNRAITCADADASDIITVTADNIHKETIHQLADINPNSVKHLISEPEGRNTAAAIAYAALYAQKHFGNEAILWIIPSDHFVEDEEALKQALEKAIGTAKDGYIATFGMTPTRPDTGYGYIKSGKSISTESNVQHIERFVEKPDMQTAQSYLEEGNYLWNSGMFVGSVYALLENFIEYCPEVIGPLHKAFSDHRQTIDLKTYQEIPAVPFDVAIMEKTKKAAVIACDIGWSDVGSWESVWDIKPKDSNGNVIEGKVNSVDTKNCFIQSNSLLIATMGLEDLVIVENRDSILIADKKNGQSMKALVNSLKETNEKEATNPPMENRPWGTFKVLSENSNYKVKELTVKPGAKLSLQMHHHRCEFWTVISGEALATINDKTHHLKQQEGIFIPHKATHRLENPTQEELIIVEVQCGDYLGEDDIIRLDDIYGRIQAA
ncbi:MAG TPA: mannose-1-phosphate guanylyltransferase/mannose-6-phosphate isomerase [Alphaproteobacteria bacterium]|nr:mannose-1-phosphate guanylyltransferase/mannose-6-phosphate isomerase [Alphaproteobacteria bacterium]